MTECMWCPRHQAIVTPDDVKRGNHTSPVRTSQAYLCWAKDEWLKVAPEVQAAFQVGGYDGAMAIMRQLTRRADGG